MVLWLMKRSFNVLVALSVLSFAWYGAYVFRRSMGQPRFRPSSTRFPTRNFGGMFPAHTHSKDVNIVNNWKNLGFSVPRSAVAAHPALSKSSVLKLHSSLSMADVGFVLTEQRYLMDRTEHVLSRLHKTKPIVAICFPIRSKSSWRPSLSGLTLVKKLIPSLEATITKQELATFEVRLYISFDSNDKFWMDPAKVNRLRSKIKFATFMVPTRKSFKGRIPHNEVTKAAYDDFATYFVRINDDSEFTTPGWITEAAQTLGSMKPRNVGAVGPTCKQGNTDILTHDFLHRYHTDMFLYYYPPSFFNWWLDDWISLVYGPTRTKKIGKWEVVHHIKSHGTRYTVNFEQKKVLGSEVAFGGARIAEFIANEYDFNKRLDAFTLSAEFQTLALAARQVMTTQVLLDSREPGTEFVLLQLFNVGFLEMTKHWICNVRPFGVLKDTIFIATDERAYAQLIDFDNTLNVVLILAPKESQTDLSYGQVAYYKLMQFRTTILTALSSVRIRFLLVESDAVWLENPIPSIVKSLVPLHNGAARDYDVISASDQFTENRLQGGFLLFEPSRQSTNLLFQVCLRLEKTMNAIVARADNDKTYVKDEGSEQLIMEGLIKELSAKKYDGRLYPLQVIFLPTTVVASGQWYSSKPFKKKVPRPMVVLNNWIAGNEAKKKRAIENHHWHLNEKHQCVASP